MGRISNYTSDTSVDKTDKFLGSNFGGQTKNFSVFDVNTFLKNNYNFWSCSYNYIGKTFSIVVIIVYLILIFYFIVLELLVQLVLFEI